MSYLQNKIQHKNWGIVVKPVFLCDVSILLNLCLKLQKAGKGGKCDVRIFVFRKLQTLFTANSDIAHKTVFTIIIHNLVIMLNLIQ